jgi:site-specific DNA recombinase
MVASDAGMGGETVRRGRGRPRKAWAPKVTTGGARPVRRAIAYVRVSTGDQAENGYGLDAQRHAVATYVAAQGWELVAMAEDLGVSGTYGLDDRERDGMPRRPGLTLAMGLLESGAADALVVTALDRIGRAPAVCATIFDRIDRAGATFASLAEPSLSSDLLRGLYAGMASDERRRILDRTRDGRQAKLEAGGVMGRVPYGYTIVGARRTARVEIVETEATVVRAIYAARATGATLARIAADLNDAGTPGPTGGTWHARAVQRILDNVAYRGALQWSEGATTAAAAIREGVLPAILPVAPFRLATATDRAPRPTATA